MNEGILAKCMRIKQSGSNWALADLDEASTPSDLDLPGYRLHPLKGALKGFWSISISANWRIVFRFEEGDAYDVDLVDSH